MIWCTIAAMPAAAMYTRIRDDLEDLARLLPRLEAELPEKARQPYGGYGSGSGGHHPLASWNTAAAMLVMDIHHGIRELEGDARYRVAGKTRSRGGSAANTGRSFEAVLSLASALSYHDSRMIAIRIESWVRRAELVLGISDPMSRLPRQPGQADPACPFCKTAGSLRVRHATGMIACLRPSCRARGSIEMGSFSGEPIIAWADGSTGLAVPAALCWAGGRAKSPVRGPRPHSQKSRIFAYT